VQDRWVSIASATLGFISTDVAISDPSDVAWPKWAGYAVAGAAAATVLYLDEIKPPFGDPKNWSTTKPDPTKKTRPYTKPDVGNRFPSGGGPDWMKKIIYGTSVLELINRFGNIGSLDFSPINNGINSALDQTKSFFNDVWNKTTQGVNDVENGLKNEWPGGN
jgi:hypothetical protein